MEDNLNKKSIYCLNIDYYTLKSDCTIYRVLVRILVRNVFIIIIIFIY